MAISIQTRWTDGLIDWVRSLRTCGQNVANLTTAAKPTRPSRLAQGSDLGFLWVGPPGFEPGTYGLKVRSSAIELEARANDHRSHHTTVPNAQAGRRNGQCGRSGAQRRAFRQCSPTRC